MGLRDYPLAELAFTRVIISSPVQDAFAQAARKNLVSFRSQINPFECRLNNHSMRWAREQGHLTCTLHFASGNPSGAPFWLRHGFIPVTHTMERRVDERIAWANQ